VEIMLELLRRTMLNKKYLGILSIVMNIKERNNFFSPQYSDVAMVSLGAAKNRIFRKLLNTADKHKCQN